MAEQKQYPSFIDVRTTEKGGKFAVVIGNLTRDVEVKSTNAGNIAKTGIALNLVAKTVNYHLGTNFADDEVIFVNINGFEKQGEFLAKVNPGKGSRLLVTGNLTVQEYEGKKYVNLSVSRFQVLNRKDSATVPAAPADAHFDGVSEDDLPF